ncbi:hypothetical protein Pmani_013237 [Petrolisthes manimaculis]|uniref:Uncharacterized protein n=1 Tax=Petrolisthes manimaculis TaxID=1843537 RepID=A0AAE1UCC7_9EUCA|nr:hypothetical protein Pmani_013237 [Petrolisthes manimaculis]
MSDAHASSTLLVCLRVSVYLPKINACLNDLGFAEPRVTILPALRLEGSPSLACHTKTSRLKTPLVSLSTHQRFTSYDTPPRQAGWTTTMCLDPTHNIIVCTAEL